MQSNFHLFVPIFLNCSSVAEKCMKWTQIVSLIFFLDILPSPTPHHGGCCEFLVLTPTGWNMAHVSQGLRWLMDMSSSNTTLTRTTAAIWISPWSALIPQASWKWLLLSHLFRNPPPQPTPLHPGPQYHLLHCSCSRCYWGPFLWAKHWAKCFLWIILERSCVEGLLCARYCSRLLGA